MMTDREFEFGVRMAEKLIDVEGLSMWYWSSMRRCDTIHIDLLSQDVVDIHRGKECNPLHMY
jgi:hypothetical protein